MAISGAIDASAAARTASSSTSALGSLLNRTQYPSDVVALVVLRRLRYKLALRD